MTAVEPLQRVRAHTRYQLADGTPVPGVTTILGVLNKPGLVPWANKLGLQGIDTRKYVDKLASIGTLAHHLVQCRLSGTTPELAAYSAEEQERAENSLRSYLAWEARQQLVPVACELRLVSERHRFGGTVDLIATLDGIPTLVDFKTSAALYPEHLHQVAAYALLAAENGFTIAEVRTLRIGRTPDEGFQEVVRRVATLAPHQELFLHCLAIYQLQRELGGGRI